MYVFVLNFFLAIYIFLRPFLLGYPHRIFSFFPLPLIPSLRARSAARPTPVFLPADERSDFQPPRFPPLSPLPPVRPSTRCLRRAEKQEAAAAAVPTSIPPTSRMVFFFRLFSFGRRRLSRQLLLDFRSGRRCLRASKASRQRHAQQETRDEALFAQTAFRKKQRLRMLYSRCRADISDSNPSYHEREHIIKIISERKKHKHINGAIQRQQKKINFLSMIGKLEAFKRPLCGGLQ